MSEERPGERVDHGPVGRAFGTSVTGNSPAFGFSIMITAAFGVLARTHPQPSVLEILLFAIWAAAGTAALEGLVTRGFRLRVSAVPSEVRLLGTALNFVSVAAAVGSAIAIAELFGTGVAWPVAGFCAAIVYVAAESLEIMAAEQIQRLRGDPQAGEEDAQ